METKTIKKPIFVINPYGVYFKISEPCELPDGCQTFETHETMIEEVAAKSVFTPEELVNGTYHIDVEHHLWSDGRCVGFTEIEESTVTEFLMTFEV